jgi:hypothetical protein
MAAHDDRQQTSLEKAQRRLMKAKQVRIDGFIARMMDDIEGREFAWWLLQEGKVQMQPFTSNALTTAFQCGELNVGQKILARITEVSPAFYVQMQQEQLNGYNAAVSGGSPADGNDEPDGGRAGSYDDASADGPDTLNG